MSYPEIKLANTGEFQREKGMFLPIYSLCDRAGITSPQIPEAITSPDTHTGRALSEMGLQQIFAAGSITWGAGNYFTTYDGFSQMTSELIHAGTVKTNPDLTAHPYPANVFGSFKLARMLGITDQASWSQVANSCEQLIDFLTGKNADFNLVLNSKVRVGGLYNLLSETLPLDITQVSFVISHAIHADRFPLIQICSTNDRYTQGFNFIIQSGDDPWNTLNSGRQEEVVSLEFIDGRAGIYTTHTSPNPVPSTLLQRPVSLGHLLANLSQEWRRTILRPDRGINLTSYRDQLSGLDPTITHEQACLATANLARSFSANPQATEKALEDVGVGRYFRQNDPKAVEAILNEALHEYFIDPVPIDPHLAELLAISMPMNIDTFLTLPPTPHPVLQAQVIQVYY